MTIASIKQIASRLTETALAMPADYEWYEYTQPQPLESKNDKGRSLKLAKGDKFGMRRGTRTATVKLVKYEDMGGQVFSCDEELAEALDKHSKPIATPKK